MAKAEAIVSARGNPRAPSVPRGLVERKDGRHLRRFTVYLEQNLARRLSVHCAAVGIGLSEFVADIVEQALHVDAIDPALDEMGRRRT